MSSDLPPPDTPIGPSAGAGDTGPEELGRIVRTHERAIFNLCYRMLGDYHDAEDCAQEAFIRAYHGLPSFKGHSSLFTWLYRIAVNTCRNRMRATRRRTAHMAGPGAQDEMQIAASEPRTSPHEQAARAETVRAVHRAVLLLPEDQRIVVVLRDFEGWPYERIAETIGLSLGTVKSRLSRARGALARELKEVLG